MKTFKVGTNWTVEKATSMHSRGIKKGDIPF